MKIWSFGWLLFCALNTENFSNEIKSMVKVRIMPESYSLAPSDFSQISENPYTETCGVASVDLSDN